MTSTSCGRSVRNATPIVAVWLVAIAACGPARQAPAVGPESLPVETAAVGPPALELVAAQRQPTHPLPPLEPLIVTQLDDQTRVPDLDTARLSLLMSQPIPIKDFLLLLVRDTRVSIVPDPNVEGTFVGELKGVTVRQALELAPLGLDYAVDDGVVRVFERQRETRIFPLERLHPPDGSTHARQRFGGRASQRHGGHGG